ncbi:MAG: GxxExxY protein, partial [Muribaculaceae bacterium]|nr:GxxExxY protein [Muribaculaceae bacterium]
MDVEKIVSSVIDCAYKVRHELMNGYLESVYENALMLELRNCGINAENQVPLKVLYKGVVVGEYRIDILVENCLIVEIKAVSDINSAHEAQLVNYLTATNIDNGLLINFGSEKLEVKRKYRVYKDTSKDRIIGYK